MPRKTFLLFLFISLLITAALTAGEFTADLSVKGPQVQMTVRISVKGDIYRLDPPEGASPMVLIHDKSTTWVINPELKQFRKFSQAEEAFVNPLVAWENMSHDMTAELVGTETLKGFKCQKYDYKHKGETKVVLERWLADDLDFVIKQVFHADNDNAVIELDSIDVTTLDEALFEIPSGYAEQTDTPEAEVPKSAGTKHAIAGSETGEAPWGRRYGPGAEVAIAMNPDFEPKVTLRNDSDGEAVCMFTRVMNGEESAPEPITLTTKGAENKPWAGFKGTEWVKVVVEKGEIFVIAEQDADSFSDKAYAGCRYLTAVGEKNGVGQGFVTKPGKQLVITITADCQDHPGAKGSIKVYKGTYADVIEEVAFDMKDNESKTWKYPATKAAQSWEILLTEGAARVRYEQP